METDEATRPSAIRKSEYEAQSQFDIFARDSEWKSRLSEAQPEQTGTESEITPKKRKKKRLTKAERKALALQRQINFKKLELRDTFRRELELSKLSTAHGRETWEEMCKEIKTTELKLELEEWEEKAQRNLNQKDEKITLMIEDIEATHEMHIRSVSKHTQLLDFLAASYACLLESIRAKHNCEMQELLRDFYEDLGRQKEAKDKVYMYYERIEHTINIVVEDQMRTSYQIYKEERDERVNNEITKRYLIRDSIVEKMLQLHKHVFNFCKGLKTSTLDVNKYEKIDYLMERQRNFYTETANLNNREKKCTRFYADLQRQLLHVEVEAQRKLNDLRLEQAYFLGERNSIKRKMKLDADITFEKLKILSSLSYEVIKKFTEIKKKGDLLLTLATMCRQYETQSEKVLPWNEAERPLGYQEDEEQIFQIKVLDLKAHVDLTEEELIGQFKLLKKFWRRQSLVELQNILLMNEKQKLLQENKKYCDFIRSMNKTEVEAELLASLQVSHVRAPQDMECEDYYIRKKKNVN